MEIRKSKLSDIPDIEKIYKSAKTFMHENGNPNQWCGEYPNGDSAKADIERGIGYVCRDGEEIVAVFAFCIEDEPTYAKIYDGAWLDDLRYAYIHRIAVKHHGRGIVDFCFCECFKMHPNLKIDTHADNIPMQRVLLRNGFIHCGTIYLEDGSPRLAYQKTTKTEENL